ncbi:hypothetical protein VTK56DRAFT_1119 [Thermocarpiscus australiensis]
MAILPQKQNRPKSETPTPFRVSIIGGGIGGLTTALFLHHFCQCQPTSTATTTTTTSATPIQVDVYEQADAYRDIGAGIGIGVNATKLLHRIPGLGAAVNAIAGSKDGVWFALRRWDDSREITTVHAGDQGEVRQAAVARAELLGLLVEFVRARGAARLHVRKKCRGIEDLGDAVRVSFEDGTSVETDLVIGADGIHSAVRRQFVRDQAVYSGKIIYRGLVPISQLPDPWPLPSYSVMWIAPGKHVVVYPISSNKTLNFVGCITKDKEKVRDFRESWTLTCDRKELEQDFEDCDEMVQKIISLLPERPSKWLINDRDPLPGWTFLGGKVTLLGDSAHAMVPHQSAGGGQAIEDAYIISRALSEYLERRTRGDKAARLDKWMGLYQDVRLPRAQRVQETSREAGYLYQLQVPEMQGKTYDECLPILLDGMKNRFKWIWAEDLDVAYDMARMNMLEAEAAEAVGSKLAWCFCM